MSTVPAGWQAIDIDGIGCLIGWIEGEDDAYWAVVRHGCQVAKGLSRESAVAAARIELARVPWLRAEKPPV